MAWPCTWNSGHGPTILGIHGTGSSALLWAGAVPELARRGRLILYDRRGCNRSVRPAPYATSVEQQTDDAAALLAVLDAAPAIVIGRSYGGEIAVNLAPRYPAVVRALVLLEPSMPMLSPQSRAWLETLRSQLPQGCDAVVAAERLIAAALGDETWKELPDGVRRIFVDNGEAIVAEVNGAWTAPTATDLARLTQPTLLLSAESSPAAFRAADDAVAAMVPGVRREAVGGGHIIDPAAPVVLDFLDHVLATLHREVRRCR